MRWRSKARRLEVSRERDASVMREVKESEEPFGDYEVRCGRENLKLVERIRKKLVVGARYVEQDMDKEGCE